jgi:tetratricopeptide (TPR) repeat protein
VNYANLGDAAGARASYEKALRLQRALVAADPADGRARRNLALTYRKLGRALQVMGDLSDIGEARRALPHAREALAAAEELAAARPGDRDAQECLAISAWTLGYVLEEVTPHQGAGLPSIRRGQAILDRLLQADRSIRACEPLVSADAANAEYQSDPAIVLARMGRLEVRTGDPTGALSHLGRGLALIEPVLAKNPSRAENRIRITLVHADLGLAHARLAQERRLTPAERAGHGCLAGVHFREAAESLKAVRKRSAFSGTDDTLVRDLPHLVAESDAILARLKQHE